MFTRLLIIFLLPPVHDCSFHPLNLLSLSNERISGKVTHWPHVPHLYTKNNVSFNEMFPTRYSCNVIIIIIVIINNCYIIVSVVKDMNTKQLSIASHVFSVKAKVSITELSRDDDFNNIFYSGTLIDKLRNPIPMIH